MNTSEESGEWTNPDGQNDRSMDDEEEEETEEEHETSSEIEEDYSVEEEDEEDDEMEDEVENSRSESSPHMHINGHGNNDENDHDEDDEDEDEEDDDDSEEEGADIGVKEDYQSKQVQQNPIPQNGNPKMTSSPREHHFVVTRQRDAVPMQQQPVKQNGNMVARQDDGDEEEEEEEIEPGIIGPLHIDHVDFILDSIDAELSDLITKSDRGSPEERKKKKNLTKKKTSSMKVSEGALQNGPQSINTTMETSLSQDHQVQPNGRYGMLPVRKKTKKTGKGRMKTRSQPSLTSPPKLRINNFSMDDSVGTTSDADSITAEEVRRRVVQSLHQQEKSRSSSLPPHNQLTCSQEYHLATTPATNHNSNINNSPLQSPPTTADNSPNAKTAEVNNNEVTTQKRMTGETKKGRTKPVGKDQEERKKRSSVSSNSSKQSNRKVPSSEPATSTPQQGSPVSDVSGAFGSRGDGSNHIVRLRDILNHYGDVGEESEKAASLATDYLVSQAAGVRNISDLESVATEDFESAFQKFAMPDSARSHRSKRQGKANPKQGKNSKPVNESAAQHLQRVKKSAPEEKKMKRTVSAPPVEPSGLPEYMYMHKEVSENDVGGDSMITEDYEAHFLAIPLKNIQTEHPGVTPKKSPSRSRRKGSSRARQTQPQSDPESVQTEDYEKRFHSMMVRRLAGVPLCSFDSVTIQSDLDSVKSLDIKKKFRKAMHKHEISGTSSIEEEDIQRSKVTPRSQRSKGSRSSSLQSSELLKMKSTMQQTKKGNPQVMHPHHPTMHLTSPALHHSSMPNLSTAVLPGHSHPSVQPQTYAPPPPRDKWRSPPRVSHLESQPSPLRKSAKPSTTQGAQHREGNIHQSEGHEPRLQSSSHEHPGLRSVGQPPQMTSTPHPSHGGGGAGYMDPQRQAEQQAMLQHMIQSEDNLRSSLDGMQASLKELKNRKQDAVEELKTLHEAVKRNKSDIQQAEEMARMSVEKGDGLRSELMVLEYQRDQARRELKDLEEGIGNARRNPPEDKASGRLAQIGLSAEEILGVIRERDELQVALETERGSHVSKEERDEVVRQLDQNRQELFESQKASRARVEKLQEDLEEGRGKIESLKLIESDLKKELSEAQEALKNSENDHQKQLLEKATTMEEMQGKATTECADLRHKLSESTRRITTLESALLDKDVVTTRMQDRIRGQGQEVLELTNKVDELEKEREMRARNAETVKEVALVELRGKLLKEKDEELDQQKKTLEKTHQEVLTKQQTQATQRQTQLVKEDEEKESELKELREKLAQQEISTRTLGDQMRQEAQEQIQKALEEQKAIFETESEKERQREALAKEDAVAIETKQLNEELKREKQLRGTLKTSHSNMKEELEKLRDENLAAGREKVEAVSKAREEARQEIQTQLDQIRDQMAQEKTRETEKLQQKLKQQDEELTQLRSEVKGCRQKQRDSSSSQSSFDQSYRSIVMELNEECRKTSNLVGSTPRKVPLFSSRNMKADSPSQTGSSKQASFNSPGRTQLMAAISNLKATNDDLRNYIKSLRDDVEKQRRATTRANREKDNEVKKLVESMGREKAQVFEGERDIELDRLHRSVSLLQDSENSLQQDVMNKDEELRQIQSNMAAWKEETALKMARKFEDELNKELEVRLEESHSGSGSFRSNHSDSRMRNSALATSTPSSAGSGETGTNKLLRHLQDRVKQLRSENTSLKQASRMDNSLEGGDSSFQKSLQLEEKDQHLYRLDQKVKLLERQLWVAEERCRENAALYSQKTAENTRLEGALTQQTKELMKVERAYTKLSHSTPTSPVP